MIKIKNAKVTEEVPGVIKVITIPFDKDFSLLNADLDVESPDIEVDGVVYIVNQLFISDNGEWINILCYEA